MTRRNEKKIGGTWGMGMDDSGPVEILPSLNQDNTDGVSMKYASGVTLTHINKGNGVKFVGERGEVFVTRSQFHLMMEGSKNHIQNFLDCVKEPNAKPITSELVGGHTAIACHLMSQAYYNKQRMCWDPQAFAFTNGTGDPAWLTRNYRGDTTLPGRLTTK